MNKKLIDNLKYLNNYLKKFSLLIALLFSLFFFSISSFSIENKILFKLNNEIITSLDISNEIKYLKILNPKMEGLDQETSLKIAKKSIIREKIKKIEIQRINENSKVNDQYLNQLIKNIYMSIDLNSISEFSEFLLKNNLSLDFVKNKISIEALWNELIFYKFSSKVKIDKEKLNKKIVENKNTSIKFFDLSEIVFNISDKKELDSKYNIIKKDIENKGFSSAALIHSISETANLGGELGLVSEKSINNLIKEKIILLNNGEITGPIIIPGGVLILKLNSVEVKKLQIDLEKELDRLINEEKNKQLNQLSIVYFNKVKKDIIINEL